MKAETDKDSHYAASSVLLLLLLSEIQIAYPLHALRDEIPLSPYSTYEYTI